MSAPITFTLLSPGGTPNWVGTDRSGKAWAADANGAIPNVTLAALVDLTHSGCSLLATGLNSAPSLNTNSTVGAIAITGANMGSTDDVTLLLTGSQSGGVNAQLPTVANAIAAIPGAVDQVTSIKFRVINSGSTQVITVTTNTGWTLTGTMTLANNTFRDFIATITPGATPTATLTSVGVGTV